MTEVESHNVGVHPANWYDTWDRHQSMSSTKGLRNAPGENNCFLNSAVQVFWHLDVFRRSFRRLNGHLCMGNSCIFCALKVIFTQLQFSDKASLTPDTLRKALAETFANDQRFQLGHMHDAAECFENILQRIHYHIANDHSEDTCTALHCLPHRKFAMTVTEELVCSCGSSSNPLTFHELVHYISATSLISQSNLMQEAGDKLHPDRFGLLLRNASAMGDVRDCPGDCGKRVQIRRTLLNVPDVVNIGIVWDSEHPSGEMITEVAHSIGTTMLLPDVFHSVMCDDSSKLPKLQLVAMVCYYGKHYSTFVFHTKLKVWIYFDDATVKEIGSRWEHVVDKCCRGRYQPLLLYYTNSTAVPISTETAPTKKTMAPGYTSSTGTPISKGEQKGQKSTDTALHGLSKAKRSLTPNTDNAFKSSGNQRSTTPGLECYDADCQSSGNRRSTTPGLECYDADCDKRKRGEHQRQPSFLFAVAGKSENFKDTLSSLPKSYPPGLIHMESLPNSTGRQGDQFYSRDSDEPHTISHNSNRPSEIADHNTDPVDMYMVSTSDQYRKPSINNTGPGSLTLDTNFSRHTEMQRKDSFKRGNSKSGADVLRYQRNSTSSSESDTSPVATDTLDGPLLPTVKAPFSPRQVNVEMNNMPQMHTRTRSQSLEDDNGGIPNNNKVNTDSTHTPVQSGLATLPRKKKGLNENVQMDSSESRISESVNLSQQNSSQSGYRQSTVQNNYLTLSGKFPYNPDNDGHSHQSSNTGNSSVQYQHSQSSSSSRHKSAQTKDKKTRKKREGDSKSSKQSSQVKISNKQLQQDQALKNYPQADNLKYVDDKCVYIDRKMVENILSHQKVHRQGSVTSHTSNSSIESDIVRNERNGSLTVDIQFDTISLESQKDSGYGSSDRNSSSSAGSITMDPYMQYFMSRSMIPPRSVRPQNQLYAYRTETDQSPTIKQNILNLPNKNIGQVASLETTGHGKPPINPKRTSPVKEESRHHVYRTKLATEHPPRKPNQITGNDSQLPNMTNQMMANKKQNHTGQYSSSNAVENNNEQSSENRPSSDVHSLCRMSEDLMDQCMLAEADGSFTLAIQQCGKAVEYLQKAMRISGLGQISFDEIQKNHNSCLLKFRALQKQNSGRKESNKSPSPQHNCSMTSTDSESDLTQFREGCHLLMPPAQPQQLRRVCQQAGPPTRSNSHESMDSLEEIRNSGSKSPSCSVDGVKQPFSQGGNSVKTQQPISAIGESEQIRNSRSNSPSFSVDGVKQPFSHGGNSVKTQRPNSAIGESEQFNIYATLPCKGKKNALNRASYNPCDNISAVQQECVHVRTSSGSSTSTTTSSKEFDTTFMNSGNDARVANSSAQQNKTSKSDIRQLLERNMIQHQQQSKQVLSMTSGQGQGQCRSPVHQPSYRVPPPYSQPFVPYATENCGSQQGMNIFDEVEHLSAGDVVHDQDPAETSGTDRDQAFRASVRDLASRFESAVNVDADNLTENTETKTVKLTRKRSKSESGSRPKSALAKNKKSISNKPRKSVTFANQISHVSTCDDWEINCRSGYRSDQEDMAYENILGSYSDNDIDDDDTSTSADSPVETIGIVCALCHKKGLKIGLEYCSKCKHYMSQFKPS